MSAIRRFSAVAVVTIGLVEGCGNDLGRPPVSWDASQGPRPAVDSSADRGAQPDAGSLADASIDAADTSVSDMTGTLDTGGETPRIEASTDLSVVIDAGLDVNLDLPAEVGLSDAPLEGGGIDILTAALLAKSRSCLSCAQTSCPSEFAGCGTIAGTPDAGLAGRDGGAATRAQLCVDTVSCLLSSQCEEIDTSFCYCGDGGRSICWVPDIARGECKDRIERSFETTDPTRILSGIESGDRDTGGGWAFLLARCLRDNACKSCFGRPDAGMDAAQEPDATIDISAPAIDVRPDIPSSVPDVAAEAEASVPRADASDGVSSPDVESDVASPPHDADQSDAFQDADTSTSDAD